MEKGGGGGIARGVTSDMVAFKGLAAQHDTSDGATHGVGRARDKMMRCEQFMYSIHLSPIHIFTDPLPPPFPFYLPLPKSISAK